MDDVTFPLWTLRALQILRRRGGQGDELASELFRKLYEAVGVRVYDADEPSMFRETETTTVVAP